MRPRTVLALRAALLGAVLILGSGFAPAAPGDVLRFEVAEGTVLRKNLQIKHLLDLEVVETRTGDGPPIPSDNTAVIQTHVYVLHDDTYERVAGGRPLSLVRVFDNVHGTSTATTSLGGGMQGQEISAQIGSPLIHRTVRFTWVEEEQDYGRAYERFNGPEVFLRTLDQDMDLIGTLPHEEVEPGDTWTLEGDAVLPLFSPGRNLLLWPPQSGSALARNLILGVGGNNGGLLRGDYACFATATYQGRREVDGIEVGVVTFEIEVFSEVDRTRKYIEYLPKEERSALPALLRSAVLAWNLRGQGELLWDLEGGHMHAYELRADQGLSFTISKTAYWTEKEPEGQPVVEESRMGGAMQISITLREDE